MRRVMCAIAMLGATVICSPYAVAEQTAKSPQRQTLPGIGASAAQRVSNW